MARLTLLDIVKQNGNDKLIGLIEEVQQHVPEVSIFGARPIKGTYFKTLVRTAYPTVGFHKPGDGTAAVSSSYETRLCQCFPFGGRIEIVKEEADTAEDGPEAVKNREAVGYMGGAMKGLASQIWYGTAQDKNGFPGCVELVDSALHLGNMSAGLTASKGSSVFAVYVNDLNGAGLVFGGNGTGILGNTMDWRIESMLGKNNLPVDGYVTSLPAWAGLQTLSKFSVARYDNLTDDSGNGLTDSALADLVGTFEEKNNGIRPTHLFMSYRSRRQLQKSRTVVLQGQGKTVPDQPTVAPTPLDYEGITIVPSTAISNTEAIVDRT